MTADELIAFEERVKETFLEAKIRGPIHLCDPSQAEPLIKIFRDIRPQDWVFASWRSHFHALLKGIPVEWLYEEICAGRSMMIHSQEHRFLTSAIVGGIMPIALGVALGIRRKYPEYSRGWPERVWCFIGDMTVRTGIAHEVLEYAHGWGLPLTVVVEDNGLSTNTPTMATWGEGKSGFNHRYYVYERKVPHTGIDQWVTFN